MHRRTARGNRIGLALVGLIVAAAGTMLLLTRLGVFGSGSKKSMVYPRDAQRFVHDNGSWLWPVLAAVAIVIGLAFLRWLIVQPRVDTLRRLVVDTDLDSAADDAGAGRTRMPARALTDVVEDDVVQLHGVRRVSAALAGQRDAPELWLRVAADADADVARIRRVITTTVIGDARACLDLPVFPTYVRLHVSRRDGRRELH